MPTWPTYGSLVLPVLHGIRYQAPPGHSIARQLQTGAIQTTIFVSCLGALLETVVRVSWWHMNFLGHKQHTTATTRVSRHQTVKPCLLMMLVPLTLQTLGGPLRKNVQRVGLMFVTVSIKGTSCHRNCTLNFLKMSRASIPWFQILPSMAPHALLGIKSLVHLGHISVLLAQTGQVPILIGASCLGASLTSGALQGFQVWFLMVLWLTTAYDTCGNTPDCYNDFSSDKRCPYDPYGTKSYKVHKGHNCECIYQGRELPSSWFNWNDTDVSDTFGENFIGVYGTTCAAWAQMPGMPDAHLCPAHADWCNSHNNWCQLPWCYVDQSCETKVTSRMIEGSLAPAYYSYDTCLSTPDCKTMPFDDACPFDSADTGWATAQECPESWSDVCDCLYQGNFFATGAVHSISWRWAGQVFHVFKYCHLWHRMHCLGSSPWYTLVTSVCSWLKLAKSQF